MSITSGFFNSLNGDRKYNAEQMSSLFDGIINDGVFANIGTAFQVKAYSGNTVHVGIGRAWFNSAWIHNDAVLPLTAPVSDVLLDRYDAVVIEVDHNVAVRNATIKIISGVKATSPKHPTLENSEFKHQYALAYLYRKAGSTEITQANITNNIGMSGCPYITGILQVQSIEKNVAQWEAEWRDWYNAKVASTNAESAALIADMQRARADIQAMLTDASADITSWKSQKDAEFTSWFNDIKNMLSGDVAADLTKRILELESNVTSRAKILEWPYKAVSGQGWKRIAVMEARDSGLFHIGNSYNTGGTTDLLFYAHHGKNRGQDPSSIVVLSNKSANTTIISQIRLVQITAADGTASYAIDVYYKREGTNKNTMYVSCHTFACSPSHHITPVNWLDVPETAEGEEVTRSYYLRRSTSGNLVTDEDLSASVSGLQNKIDEKASAEHTHDYAPTYSYGTEDLTAGSSELPTGKLHFVYE